MACKCKTEVYSRIVGYYRPIQQWNRGKREEYHNRSTYKFDISRFQTSELPKKSEVAECRETT